MYIYIYIYTYIYIYVYTYVTSCLRRDDPGPPDQRPSKGHTWIVLAQDKGGPSKGGFLNNRLFPELADLYSCHEMNGMCIYT